MQMHNCLQSAVAKQVLLLIDWENLFYGLFRRFGAEEMRIEARIKKLMDWIKTDIGELLGGYGFVFAPEHLSYRHQQTCVEDKLRLMICPKKHFVEPRTNPKTGDSVTEEDTVDETIIWFTKTMVRHPNFKCICLVSGDSDYIPLLEEMPQYGIKRALAIPTIDCLSKNRELTSFADRSPITDKKMLMRLDNI